MSLLLPGNSKLGKRVLSFSLPAVRTCKPSPWCLKHCYACKGFFKVFADRVNTCYEKNYQASLSDTFVNEINQELTKRGWGKK